MVCRRCLQCRWFCRKPFGARSFADCSSMYLHLVFCWKRVCKKLSVGRSLAKLICNVPAFRLSIQVSLQIVYKSAHHIVICRLGSIPRIVTKCKLDFQQIIIKNNHINGNKKNWFFFFNEILQMTFHCSSSAKQFQTVLIQRKTTLQKNLHMSFCRNFIFLQFLICS